MKLIERYKPVSVILAILLFVTMQPYFVWGIMKYMTYIQIAMLLIFMANIRINENKQLFLFVFFAISLLIIPIYHQNNISGIVSFVLIAAVPFLKDELFKGTYQVFLKIYTITISISMIVWVLYLLRIPLPYNQIDPLNSLKQWETYYQYPMLIVSLKFDSGIFSLIRFFGIYDEPGVVGTASLLLLYINKFNYKKISNIILLLSGIISFSLFFYVGLFAYHGYKIFRKDTSKRSKLIFTGIAVGMIFFITFNEAAYDILGVRFAYDEQKKSFAGDSRATDDLKYYINEIRGTTTYFFGDTQQNVENYSDSAGYRNEILRYGALYLFCFIFFIIKYTYNYTRNDKEQFWTSLAMFFMCLYQRPGIVVPIFIFLYCALSKISYLQNKEEYELQENRTI